MENPFTSHTLSGSGAVLISALFGGVAGWLIADLLVYKLEEREFQKLVNDATEEYEENIAADPGLIAYIGDPEEVIRKRVDYAGMNKGDLEELVRPYMNQSSPAVISFEEWADNDGEYDRTEVIYYAEDLVFADEAGEPMLDHQNLFGPNIHLHFGERSDDDDTVYVANPDEETLYQIVRVQESYAVKVLGEPAEEKPKKVSPKRVARSKAAKVKEEKENDTESDE